jgi:hypothetical protein
LVFGKKKRGAFIDPIEMQVEGSKLARESSRPSQREREGATSSRLSQRDVSKKQIKKFITEREE